jgi:hypothetical protein
MVPPLLPLDPGNQWMLSPHPVRSVTPTRKTATNIIFITPSPFIADF